MAQTCTIYIGKEDSDMFSEFVKRHPKPYTSKAVITLIRQSLASGEEKCLT